MKRKEVQTLIKHNPNQLFYYGRAGTLKSYAAWKKNSRPELVRIEFNKWNQLRVGRRRTSEWSDDIDASNIWWTDRGTALGLVLATKEDGDVIIAEYEERRQAVEDAIAARKAKDKAARADIIRRFENAGAVLGIDMVNALAYGRYNKLTIVDINELLAAFETAAYESNLE